MGGWSDGRRCREMRGDERAESGEHGLSGGSGAVELQHRGDSGLRLDGKSMFAARTVLHSPAGPAGGSGSLETRSVLVRPARRPPPAAGRAAPDSPQSMRQMWTVSQREALITSGFFGYTSGAARAG